MSLETRMFFREEEQDPESDLCSTVIFVDCGARLGELYKNNGTGKYVGSFFKLSEDKKDIIIRDDLGSHVDYYYMPFKFKLNRTKFTGVEFHLFEPNPEYFDELCETAMVISQATGPVFVHPKAVSTKYSTMDFYLTDGGWGSSLKEDKLEDFTDSITVETIDFVDFLTKLNKRKNTNEIHVKLDIEGTEYDILPELFNAFPSTLRSLSVEFHRDHFPKEDRRFWFDHNFSYINLIKRGIDLNWWPGEW